MEKEKRFILFKCPKCSQEQTISIKLSNLFSKAPQCPTHRVKMTSKGIFPIK